jgi:hypothetical protein
MFGIRLDFGPEAGYQHVDAAVEGGALVSPQQVQETVPIHDPVRVGQKDLEQIEFAAGQGQGPLGAGQLSSLGIETIGTEG